MPFPSVTRAVAKLRHMNKHVHVGLLFQAALVRCMKLCPRCNKKFTLYNLPETCDACGRGDLFGEWGRINYRLDVAAKGRLRSLRGLTGSGL